MGDDKELTHIDLFSGIGGFTLAAEWAGFKTVVFCEKEEFCQKVLKKHWSGAPIIPEIRDFDGTKWRGATLLTGGFPCQPFSVAGQRRGKEDDRYLWPEMLRVIIEAKPRWILAENVPGIVRMALDTVLSDLEDEGYSTGTFIIPACGLNAPHRRNRVWIVGYSTGSGYSSRCEETRRTKRQSEQGGLCEPKRTDSHAPDSEFKRPISGESQEWSRYKERIFKGDDSNASNPTGGRQFECLSERKEKRNSCEGDKRNLWQEDWYEVAARFCRVDDGVPDRIHRLKALGNAIVPQIAYEIIKNIAWIEKELK